MVILRSYKEVYVLNHALNSSRYANEVNLVLEANQASKGMLVVSRPQASGESFSDY